MSSFVRGMGIGIATGLSATAVYLGTQAARRGVDRSLARVEEVAGEAPAALDGTREARGHTARRPRRS
jgi:hypothetical protein